MQNADAAPDRREDEVVGSGPVLRRAVRVRNGTSESGMRGC